MKIVSFSLEDTNKYFAKIDGTRFFVGKRVPYGALKGLTNTTGTGVELYDRSEFRHRHGIWADLVHPTSSVEGLCHHCLNTYDSARFTFGFLQFAAHVPDGDFVLYLRELLKLPQAIEYFPDLRLEAGRVVRLTDDGVSALETSQSTAGLMDYLNPSSQQIEDTEVIQAAKLIHWVQNDPVHRRAQVEAGIAHFKTKMASYDRRYGFDGVADSVCCVVADIRHQGRAKSPEIAAALDSSNPLESLLRIGSAEYPTRIKGLRKELSMLVAEGRLGRAKYSTELKDFVPLQLPEAYGGAFYQEPNSPAVFSDGLLKRTIETVEELDEVAARFAPYLRRPDGTVIVEQVPPGYLDGVGEARRRRSPLA